MQDLWDFLLVWEKSRPEYPFAISVMTTSPGWHVFTSRLAVGLTNPAVFVVVAYAIALGAKPRSVANCAAILLDLT
jgi:hypothetical protein